METPLREYNLKLLAILASVKQALLSEFLTLFYSTLLVFKEL